MYWLEIRFLRISQNMNSWTHTPCQVDKVKLRSLCNPVDLHLFIVESRYNSYGFHFDSNDMYNRQPHIHDVTAFENSLQ